MRVQLSSSRDVGLSGSVQTRGGAIMIWASSAAQVQVKQHQLHRLTYILVFFSLDVTVFESDPRLDSEEVLFQLFTTVVLQVFILFISDINGRKVSLEEVSEENETTD